MFPRHPISRIHRFFTYDTRGQLLAEQSATGSLPPHYDELVNLIQTQLPDGCGSIACADSAQNQNINYRCPITQCAGWVDLIDTHSPPFWGCGSVWYEESNFQKEITEITILALKRIRPNLKNMSALISSGLFKD